MVTGAGAVGRGHLMDKQSLVPVVQELWKVWEIHFLILVSLFLQVFLFLFAGMRRRNSKGFLRTVLWLAYLSADSVAIFVLGHLAVRAREPGHELMALWAPFVLVHLGGQDTITAFSKQDNELWRRHLLNLILQTAVAGYVVAKASWPDTRLRTAMVLMFISGFYKYAERTGCLYFSGPENLRLMSKTFLMSKLKRKTEDKVKENLRKRWEVTLDMMKKGSSAKYPVLFFMDAYAVIQELIVIDAPLNKEHAIAVHGDLQSLLQGFLSKNSHHNAYEYVGAILENCYRFLYTKELARYQILHLLFNPITTIIAASIAIALFRAAVDKAGDQLHNSSSSSVDIMVTYILLVGAIALDVLSVTTLIFRHLSFFCLPCLPNYMKQQQWSQELRQYNIISTAGKPGMFWMWRWLACDVDRIQFTKDHKSIKKFILDTLLAAGTRKEWRITSTRGQLALKNHSTHFATTMTLESLKEAIASSADFPTSVLVLHIATDICYHYGDGGTNFDHQAWKKHKQTSIDVSNYIMYLVFKCGVMLTTNSKIAHDNARDEIAKALSQPRKIHTDSKKRRGDFAHSSFSPFKRKVDHDVVMRLIEAVKEPTGELKIRHQESEEQQDSTIEIENQESTDIDDDNADDDDHIKKLRRNSKTLKSPVLPRAVAVAQELISIENEAKRWELIAAVWAEMLYYTAARCGGDFHYEHLSTGGEFVTHVLLLMYYLGPFLPPPS